MKKDQIKKRAANWIEKHYLKNRDGFKIVRTRLNTDNTVSVTISRPFRDNKIFRIEAGDWNNTLTYWLV